MIFHLFQHLKIHNSACLVDGLKETNPDAIKQHNWHSNRIRYLKKKKKRLWRQIKLWNSKENNSERPQNLNLIASKSIWIQCHPKKKKNYIVISRNNFFNYIHHLNQSRSQRYERPTTLIHTNKQKDKCPSILASI